MKNRLIVLICFILFIPLLSQGQPVLHDTDLEAEVDSVWYVAKIYPFDPGPGGANMHWNFNTLQNIETHSWKSVEPSGSTCFWQDCNLFWSDINSMAYFFGDGALVEGGYKLSSDGMVLTNYYTTSLSMACYGMDVLRFPFEYGMSYIDTVACSGSSSGGSNGAGISFKGPLHVEADAYGELITPSDTFPSVIRRHIWGQMLRSYETMNSLDTLSFNIDLYTYYAPGNPLPVLHTAVAAYDSMQYWSYNSFYQMSPTVGLRDDFGLPLSDIRLSPNPANRQIRVDFNLQYGTEIQYAVYSITGKKIAFLGKEPATPGLNHSELNLPLLPSGMYILKISVDDIPTSRLISILRE